MANSCEQTNGQRMNWLVRVRQGAGVAAQRHTTELHVVLVLALHGVVVAYVAGATAHWFMYAGGSFGENIDFCDGVGMVWVLAGLLYLALFYFQIVKPYFGRRIHKTALKPASAFFNKFWSYRFFRLAVYVLLLTSIVIFLAFDTANERERLISCCGTIVLILIGFVFSKHPGHISWRPVFWGLGLQFLFALFSIRWPPGRALLQCVGDKVSTFLFYSDEGSALAYGDDLVHQWKTFAFQVMPVIYFFSFCIQILYYYGAMQWVVLKLGWLLQVTLGTTVCESVNAAGSIFLGPSESPLLFRPYICQLTRSELHAVMTGALSTVAGSTMAAYMSFGVSASHLLAASVMSAPAALSYSKLFYPETEQSLTSAQEFRIEKCAEKGVLEAASKGANDVIFLILAICANLIAFVAFMSFANSVLSWFGAHIGVEYITFEWLLGKTFIPLAYLMGVAWEDCADVATLVGLKTVVNEFVAYEKLGEYIRDGRLSARSEAIATYAMCGFSNPGSTAIMMSSLAILAPSKRRQITHVAPRALVSACAACFLTACSAGALIQSSSLATSSNTLQMNLTYSG